MTIRNRIAIIRLHLSLAKHVFMAVIHDGMSKTADNLQAYHADHMHHRHMAEIHVGIAKDILTHLAGRKAAAHFRKQFPSAW